MTKKHFPVDEEWGQKATEAHPGPVHRFRRHVAAALLDFLGRSDEASIAARVSHAEVMNAFTEVTRALTAQREQVAELQAATVVMGTEMERLAEEVSRVREHQETGTSGLVTGPGGRAAEGAAPRRTMRMTGGRPGAGRRRCDEGGD